MTEATRLLVVLPQMPDDPASGASRTVTTIASLMADAGYEVEALVTTSNEGHRRLDVAEVLAYLGVAPALTDNRLRFLRRGVRYTMLDTGLAIGPGMSANADIYDQLLDDVVQRFRPHVALTFGGSTREVARQRRLTAAGVHVVFGLYNMRYFRPGFFDHLQTVITPSRYLTDRYRDAVGLRSTPLVGPLWPADVVADEHEPTRVTIVNPTLDKGLMVFLSFAKILARERPEIGLDLFVTRDSERTIRQVAFLGGVDLDRPEVMFHKGTSLPWELYRRARVVAVPSLFDDPAPRAVPEALANGAVPIGSDRGGIPELCGEAGMVVPTSRHIHPLAANFLPDSVARPWFEAIAWQFDDEAHWRQASARAREAATPFLPPAATLAYLEFFDRVLDPGRHRGRRAARGTRSAAPAASITG